MSKTIGCSCGFPKVGIRPVIDGRRRGVRESLEEQTMNMAKSAAQLISEGLKYPDGSPVQCVISDTNIGGCAEAAACAAKFERENVGVSRRPLLPVQVLALPELTTTASSRPNPPGRIFRS